MTATAGRSSLRGHEGDAYLDTVTFPIITEPSVRTGGLESGEYDLIQDLPYVDEARYTNRRLQALRRGEPGRSELLRRQHDEGAHG